MVFSSICALYLLIYGYSVNYSNVKNICIYSKLTSSDNYQGETFVDIRNKLGWITFVPNKAKTDYLSSKDVSLLIDYLNPCLKSANLNFVEKAIRDFGVLGYYAFDNVQRLYPFLENKNLTLLSATLETLANLTSFVMPVEWEGIVEYREVEKKTTQPDQESFQYSAPASYLMREVDNLTETQIKKLTEIFYKTREFIHHTDSDIRIQSIYNFGKYYNYLGFKEREIIVEELLKATESSVVNETDLALMQLGKMSQFSEKIIKTLNEKISDKILDRENTMRLVSFLKDSKSSNR